MNLDEAIDMIKECLTQDFNVEVNFSEYKPCGEKPLNLIAIDGSATFIFNVSTLWLGIIRVCALEYEFENGYYLRDRREEEYVEIISTHKALNDIQDKLLRNFPFATPNFIINELRRLYEINLLRKIAEEKKNVIIAMDGALTTTFLKGLDEEVKKILEICKKNENLLIGVAKDSKTHAFHHSITDVELLERKAKDKDYCYVELPESFIKRCKPPLYGKAYFARLFPKARWFRIDIANEVPPELVFSQLSCYARSKLSLGYVYPLVEAHKLAIKVNQLREIYEERFKEEALRKGIPLHEILGGITNAEGRSYGAYHTYLDEISEW